MYSLIFALFSQREVYYLSTLSCVLVNLMFLDWQYRKWIKGLALYHRGWHSTPMPRTKGARNRVPPLPRQTKTFRLRKDLLLRASLTGRRLTWLVELGLEATLEVIEKEGETS